MNIYILKNESGVVGTTESLDHATLHKLTGGTYEEKPHYESSNLYVELDNGQIYISSDEQLAEVTFETYTEETIVCLGRVFVEYNRTNNPANVVKVALEDCNFTKDFVHEIEIEIYKEVGRLQESLNNELAERDIDNYYFN